MTADLTWENKLYANQLKNNHKSPLSMSILKARKLKTISDPEVNRSSCLCLQGFQIVPAKADLSRRELIGLDIANVLASDHAISKYLLPVRI